MAAPTTGFEDTGNWTTLAQETAYLTQIATETDMVLTEAGRTVQNRPIHRVDLGAGTDQTMLITCLVHGNEQASREGALKQIRELAYSTDPAVTAYLAAHRIVWLTNVNADMFPTNRLNANAVNINRDHYQLTQPESEVIGRTIAAVDPHLIVDAHEFFNPGSPHNYLSRGGGLPSTLPAMQSLADDLNETCKAAAVSAGLTAGDYYLDGSAPSMLSVVASVYNVTGFLSETNGADDTPAVRVDTQEMILGVIRQWHEDNAAALTTVKAASIQHANTTNQDYPLVTGTDLGANLVVIPIANLAGYQTTTPVPQKYRDVFGIEVDASGFVSMNQPARAVIPVLMDPQSDEVSVTATRVYRDPPPGPVGPMPDGVLSGVRVMVNGRPRPVIQIRHKVGGAVRVVDL